VTWKPSKPLGITAQLKVETSRLVSTGDVNLTRTLTYAKPRVVLSYSLDKNTQVRFREEHEVLQINFFNFVANSEFNSGSIRAGNPNLRPQRQWVTEATIERQFWTGASMVLTLRHRDLIDVLDAVPVGTTGAFAQGNIGRGKSTDVIATLTMPLKRLGLDGAMVKGSVTAIDARVTDPVTHLKRQMLANPLNMDLHFAYDMPRQKLNWGVDTLTSGTFILARPAGREINHPFTRLDAYIEYRYRPTLTFRLEVANITNVHPLQRIEYYAGLRNVAPLLYSDNRTPGAGQRVLFRVRRTF
jgi:outer membrane receptor protein involved in Fe transport